MRLHIASHKNGQKCLLVRMLLAFELFKKLPIYSSFSLILTFQTFISN